jgi:glycolate oxidase FAD binding subunit
VAARASALRELLAPAEVESVDPQASAALWRELGSAAALASYPVVWRVSVPPSHAPRAVAALAPERYLLDWGGGLILAAYRDVDAARVRGAVPAGHATLLKAPASARRAVSSFPPQPPALAALGERVKRAFDPEGKLNPGRME